MNMPLPVTLFEHFSAIEDPREENKRRHLLIDILILAIAGVLGGADGWVQIELFGKAKEAWFRRFLELPHGIASVFIIPIEPWPVNPKIDAMLP
jgi:hypothetical protein